MKLLLLAMMLAAANVALAEVGKTDCEKAVYAASQAGSARGEAYAILVRAKLDGESQRTISQLESTYKLHVEMAYDSFQSAVSICEKK